MPEPSPKVSVIVPNYNHGAFLRQRLESILHQTYQGFELLFLDDASTDDSVAVFSRLADDPRIRAFHNTVNSGSPFIQWNRGVRAAQGKFLWIAESDDYAEPDFLEALVDRLDGHPSVGIAYCQSRQIDEQGNVLACNDPRAAELDPDHWTRDFVRGGQEECGEYLVVRNTIPNASAALLRRSVYVAAGGADEGLVIASDWLLWARMLKTSDIAFVKEPLNNFRRHGGTVRSRSVQEGVYLEENYKVLAYILGDFDVPFAAAEKARDARVREWINHVVWKRRPLTWERQRRIYRLAREVDSRPLLRFAKNLLRVPFQEGFKRATVR